MIRGDIGRMVNCGLSLIGPLPPMTWSASGIEMDKVYAEGVYAMASRDAEWWERGKRARAGNASSRSPASSRCRRASRRSSCSGTTFAYECRGGSTKQGPQSSHCLGSLCQGGGSGGPHNARASRRKCGSVCGARPIWTIWQWRSSATWLRSSVSNYSAVSKTRLFISATLSARSPIIASLFLKLGYLIVSAIGLALITDAVARRWFDYHIDWASVLDRATTIGWIQVAVIAVLLIVIRRIVIRLGLPDTELNPDR